MNLLRCCFILICLFGLSACSQPEQATVDVKVDSKEANPPSTKVDIGAFSSYLELKVYSDVSRATHKAQELDSKLSAFLYSTTQESLEDAQRAWRSAYDAYLAALIYSRLPINDPPEWRQNGISQQQTLTLIDSWPIEGGYIDYVDGYPFSGIVNDLALPLTSENLIKQHGFADPSYVSLGFHALEFMLWGEDGQRSPKDFIAKDNTAVAVISDDMLKEKENIEAIEERRNSVQNHHRRRQYVQLVSDQLQKNLQRLQSRWEPSNGYYASVLQRSQPEQVLRASFIATQNLISDELLSKRLNGNSSEFSNTSWADISAIIQGIRLLYLPEIDSDYAGGGLQHLLPGNKHAIITEWQDLFAAIDGSIEKWQQADAQDTGSRQQCRQHLIDLLSLLKRTAGTLSIDMPAID